MLLTGVVRAALFSRGADREEGSSVATSFVATLLLPFVKQHVKRTVFLLGTLRKDDNSRGGHEVVGGNVLRQQVEACVAMAKTAPLPPRGLGATRGDHENEVVGGKVSNKKVEACVAVAWRQPRHSLPRAAGRGITRVGRSSGRRSSRKCKRMFANSQNPIL
jgi:hypothetical protein